MTEHLEIGDELFYRLVQFKDNVVDPLLGEESPDFGDYVEGMLEWALDDILVGIIGSDAGTLSQSFVQLAEAYPEQVYRYVREVLERGEESDREAARSRIGFVALAGRE